ncbi:MAG: hypothetical protein Q8Q08_08825 [Candidatus Omnitrophota bacterium]|nr:hypothetical protein [Candidatus Omnitrophota bacterium]MDZ4243362.1 hypothetical protein [Candidatus Omnitrophota bacterium]
MKKTNALILIFLFLVSGVYAQSALNQEIPEGMEAIQIGGSGWLIVPKGAKMRKVGAQIIVEGVREYMSRRFEETDDRLTNLEMAVEILAQEIEYLRPANQELPAEGGSTIVP